MDRPERLCVLPIFLGLSYNKKVCRAKLLRSREFSPIPVDFCPYTARFRALFSSFHGLRRPVCPALSGQFHEGMHQSGRRRMALKSARPSVPFPGLTRGGGEFPPETRFIGRPVHDNKSRRESDGLARRSTLRWLRVLRFAVLASDFSKAEGPARASGPAAVREAIRPGHRAGWSFVGLGSYVENLVRSDRQKTRYRPEAAISSSRSGPPSPTRVKTNASEAWVRLEISKIEEQKRFMVTLDPSART